MFGSFNPFGSFRPFGTLPGARTPAVADPFSAIADPFLAVLIDSEPESVGEAEADPFMAVLIQ